MVLTAPLVYYIKARIPVTDSKAARKQPIYFGFLKLPLFWFMGFANTIQGVGYFIPTVFLPSACNIISAIVRLFSVANWYMTAYADSIGLSELAGSSTLSLLNAATTIGG